MVRVHKGDWDKSRGADGNHEFTRAWPAAAQRILKPNGSMWVSGTAHVIHSVGFAMQQLGFKLLNDISWVKPNPPPNLSCRYFTHATETIRWTAKNKKSRHTFNYKLMKEANRGKQMKSVWDINSPEKWEKHFGKHPAQKPVAPLERILLASRNEGDIVLDPSSGGGTTAVAAFRTKRGAIGLELSYEYLSVTPQGISSELVRVAISVAGVQFSVDPFGDPMDQSDRAIYNASKMSGQLHLVRQECRYYFVGRQNREVIFTADAVTIESAREKFRATGRSDSDALHHQNRDANFPGLSICSPRGGFTPPASRRGELVI
jgi:site-specific DNA-methyltransferase (adenine-specific)